MLASLLPGLRDVRVPLTVGYLWIVVGWIWFSDDLPLQRPGSGGMVDRVSELGELLGRGALAATVSFVAYVLGVLLTLPTEKPTMQKIFRRAPTMLVEPRATEKEYLSHVETLARRVGHQATEEEIERARRTGTSELRPRLLVANPGLYGEYDRLVSEGSFRLNLCPPLLALAITAAVEMSWWYLLWGVAVVGVLAYHGVARNVEAVSVIQRATIAGTIGHPLVAMSDQPGSGANA